MVEDTFTLTTFYRFWKAYQDHIKGALAPLTAEQLGLRAAPHLRSIGENVLHIIGTRVGWRGDGRVPEAKRDCAATGGTRPNCS